MKKVFKARIEIIGRVTAQNPGYKGQGVRKKNNFEARCQIILTKEAAMWIGFKEVRVNLRELTINRASSVGYSSKRMSDSRISIPIEEDLVGDYELVKINEDCFQLVKL